MITFIFISHKIKKKLKKYFFKFYFLNSDFSITVLN